MRFMPIKNILVTITVGTMMEEMIVHNDYNTTIQNMCTRRAEVCLARLLSLYWNKLWNIGIWVCLSCTQRSAVPGRLLQQPYISSIGVTPWANPQHLRNNKVLIDQKQDEPIHKTIALALCFMLWKTQNQSGRMEAGLPKWMWEPKYRDH